MTLFHKIAEQQNKCETCGKDTIALYGCGWENDIIYIVKIIPVGQNIFSQQVHL